MFVVFNHLYSFCSDETISCVICGVFCFFRKTLGCFREVNADKTVKASSGVDTEDTEDNCDINIHYYIIVVIPGVRLLMYVFIYILCMYMYEQNLD